MAISMVRAARLTRDNRARARQLADRHRRLVTDVEVERDAHGLRRMNLYYTTLVPFCEAFLRLKNVDLGALEEITLPSPTTFSAAESAGPTRTAAVHGLAAAVGGAVLGAGAGSAAFAGVGAFAAASTGTPISSLAGAAATNATLAWLGGGSLATGGGGIAAGTAVLTGVTATPVVVVGAAFIEWRGRRELRDQRDVEEQLSTRESVMAADERRCAEIIAWSRRLRLVLSELQDQIASRLDEFVSSVQRNDDFASYSTEEQTAVMTVVRLVSVASRTMSARLTDDTGSVSYDSVRIIDRAREVLDAVRTTGGDTTVMGSAA